MTDHILRQSPMLSSRTFQQIAETFFPVGSECQSRERLSGGFSDACVVKVESNGTLFVLRATPAKQVDVPLLLEQHHWLRQLAAQRFPVAVPLRNPLSGSTVMERHQMIWQMEPWMPGRPVDGSSLSAVQLHGAMELLARLHHLPSSSHQRGTPQSLLVREELLEAWSPARQVQALQNCRSAPLELRQELEPFLDRLPELAPGLRQDLRTLKDVPFTLQWCFRDLWSAHVLFSQDQVTGLIDPHAARVDHRTTDLSRLSGSWFGDDRIRRAEAISLYERVFPLNEREHQLLRILDRSGVLLSGLTWVTRWQQRNILPDQLEAVLSRLKPLRQRLESL